MVAASVVIATACSGGNDGDAETTAEPASETIVDTAAGTTPGSIPDTTAATPPDTSEPPVDPPPAPTATVSVGLLADASGATYDDDVWDAAAAPGRGAVVVVGTRSARDGAPPAPMVWNFIGDQVIDRELPLGDAVEAVPRGVAIDERRAVVVGTALDEAGLAQTAVWGSSDGGNIFGPPDTTDIVFSSVAVAMTDAATVVVGATGAGDDRRVVALRGMPGEETVEVDLGAFTHGWVTDVIADGDIVLATGGYEVDDGTSRATTWLSSDGGISFDHVAPELLASRDWFGGLSLGGDGIIGVANSAGIDGPILLTSADGGTWRAIPIQLTNDGQPRTLSGENGLGVASGPAGLLFTVDDVYPRPALLGADGVGAERRFGDILEGMPTMAYPFAFFDLMYVTVVYPTVVTTASPDLFGADPFAAWSHAPADAVANGDLTQPEATGARLMRLGDAVYANSLVWPFFTELEGAVLWGDGTQPLRLDGADWRPADDEFPGQVTDLASDDDVQLLISHQATDPEDDLLDGPAGGVFGRIREADASDAAWGAPFPILTGPGGEGYSATVAAGGGFVVVGTYRAVTPEGTGVVTPIAARVVDGAATPLPLDLDLGEYATFDSAAATGELVVATGSVLHEGIFHPPRDVPHRRHLDPGRAPHRHGRRDDHRRSGGRRRGPPAGARGRRARGLRIVSGGRRARPHPARLRRPCPGRRARLGRGRRRARADRVDPRRRDHDPGGVVRDGG